MQPEPVVTCLIAGRHFDWPAHFPGYPGPNSLNQLKQQLGIACLHLVPTGLLRQGRLKTHDPAGFTQLDCNKAVGHYWFWRTECSLCGLPLVSPMRLMVDVNRTGTTSSAKPA